MSEKVAATFRLRKQAQAEACDYHQNERKQAK